ncbi:DUF899 domain-containing protein [Chitinophaga rhizophila]|uniref:Thioredoxin family protein n=1 Tax=Chitinophaga rhizophila TaxID=2866212 RepID=A0ABS7G556_9BACT|nr:thioredoxin family protein [Chitinophaga rhizophila]MBW8682789.1 thioredoxin family protein [Chitinophaga rhizophila]
MKAYNNDQTVEMEHPVVDEAEWIKARTDLLKKEKELTRLRDELSKLRRDLPWQKVDKVYIFEGADGPVSLSELFEGRSQLIVQHFMMAPGWKEGCVGCSFMADNVDSGLVHLLNHDVSYVAISRAPYKEIVPFRERMGWSFKWVSSFNTDFNFDYHVSATEEDIARNEMMYNYENVPVSEKELPGMSVFYKDEHGDIYHTYSTYGRGAETVLGTYNMLDMTPKGRNEKDGEGNLTDWVKHHDKYQHQAPEAHSCCSH